MKLVNIGFGNLINSNKILSVITPDSAPAKRIVGEAKEEGRIIDATQGRKTKSVIITNSNHIVLSYLATDVLATRINDFKESNVED